MCSMLLDSSNKEMSKLLNPFPVASLHVWSLLELLELLCCVGLCWVMLGWVVLGWVVLGCVGLGCVVLCCVGLGF